MKALVPRPEGLVPDPKKALVLGGGECLWDDVRRFVELLDGKWDGIIIAVNEAGVHWPYLLDYWVSFHPENFPAWEWEREQKGYPDGYVTCARRRLDIVQRRVKPWGGGSSGLLAVSLASDVGSERTVLCGVPMDRRPHFHDRDGGLPWTHADSHWEIWVEQQARLMGWVRSMSGRTRELLGEPTLEWLEGT